MCGLLLIYESEKSFVKCYVIFVYLGCGGVGGSCCLFEVMGELIEFFYLVIFIYDDIVDFEDELV